MGVVFRIWVHPMLRLLCMFPEQRVVRNTLLSASLIPLRVPQVTEKESREVSCISKAPNRRSSACRNRQGSICHGTLSQVFRVLSSLAESCLAIRSGTAEWYIPPMAEVVLFINFLFGYVTKQEVYKEYPPTSNRIADTYQTGKKHCL